MKRPLAPIAAVAALLAIALCLSACGGASGGREGGTLRVTYASFPDYLDPALSYDTESYTAMYNTYVPLLTYAHADGKAGSVVIPGLAKALPKVTDGGRTYTLFLRQGLRYSDGTPVRASDFTHSVERMFKLNSGGSFFYTGIVGAERFAETKRGGIAGIETDDKSGEIVIHLVEPRGTFDNELGLMFVAPLPPDTPDEDLSADPPPATGPYAIVKSEPGKGWEYERNPQWQKTNAKLMPQLPSGHVDKIDVTVVRNPSTQVNDVEQGAYDWMQNPPPADRIAEVKSKYDGTQFRTEPQINTYYFWMNTQKPPFDDVKVRQAVNYAVDPAALERIYAGQIAPTHQILPPGMPGYKKFELYPPDLAKAKQMIREAAPADREITVWTDTESPNDEAGEYYESVLKEIGFETTLKIVNSDNYFTLVGNTSTPNLDTGWGNWFEDYPHPNDFFQPLLDGESIASTNNTNWPQIDVPALNDKIAQLATEQLGPKQEAEYAALDRSYMEEAPWAPYGNLSVATFVSNEIDLDKVIFNPTFGQDLTSFQFK
ncbi:MAG: peptide/nickel transport system substrate-binding protein [Solirubrobacterales bacterium]|jgi:peptide/nickel transport system substrate-binding protein|nr:peptide/nickel transport system substrate-binding protein [Solirubrobacterales bacterium]